jgi:CSLREA domain-containing protein
LLTVDRVRWISVVALAVLLAGGWSVAAARADPDPVTVTGGFLFDDGETVADSGGHEDAATDLHDRSSLALPFAFHETATPRTAQEGPSSASATASLDASVTSGAAGAHVDFDAETTATATSGGNVEDSALGEAQVALRVNFTVNSPTPYHLTVNLGLTDTHRAAVAEVDLTRVDIAPSTTVELLDGPSTATRSGTLQPGTYVYAVSVSNDAAADSDTPGPITRDDNGAADFRLGSGLVVDSTGDEPDANPGDGDCASTAAPATCTLRAALQELDAGTSTAPIPITFDLPGGATTIAPGSPLPAATRSALIDGTTNPGGRVVIAGAGVGSGLEIGGDGSAVRGLDVEGFGEAGILVHASNVMIGGRSGDSVPCAFPCNVVRSNAGSGIVVSGAGSTGNRIVGNRLLGNAKPQIDLGDDGRTANDSDDSDTGANGLRNFPVGVLGESDPVTGTVKISGVAAPRDEGATVDVYAQSSVDSTSGAEPVDFVGTATVTPTGAFEIDRPTGLPAGDTFYSATLTDPTNGTSELSPICGDPDGDGNPDSDGDGVCDDWEMQGIDYDDDGTIDLPLSGSPTHKDLYLEVDAMQGSPDYAPSQGAIDDVVAAFANAPVPNATGGTGVALHINPGEGPVDDLVPEDRSMAATGTGPQTLTRIRDGDPNVPCDGFFGTQAERSSPDCWKALGARAMVFRYALFAYSYTEQPGSSGRALGIGGSTITVTLGSWSDASVIVAGGGTSRCSDRASCARITDAATLMHEFGHALGLHHGGRDNLNHKPNYLSVMNYTFQFRDIVDDRPLDYSRWTLPSLDEHALVKSDGILGGENPVTANAVTSEWPKTGFVAPLPPGAKSCPFAAGPTRGPIDWDGQPASSVAATSIDACQAALTTLVSNNDWPDLRYSLRDQPGAITLSGAGPTPADELEQTNEDILERAATDDVNGNGINDLADACREVPGSGFADANGNGFADVCEADMNRLQAFPSQPGGTGSIPAPGGGSVPAGPVKDTIAPVLSKLSAHPSIVQFARAHHRARVATLRFTVSEASVVTFTAEQALRGRRVGKRCLTARRHGAPCTLYKRVGGSLRVNAKRGTNSVTFTARLGARKLKAGRYRLTAVAIDAAGNRSKPLRITITVRSD